MFRDASRRQTEPVRSSFKASSCMVPWVLTLAVSACSCLHHPTNVFGGMKVCPFHASHNADISFIFSKLGISRTGRHTMSLSTLEMDVQHLPGSAGRVTLPMLSLPPLFPIGTNHSTPLHSWNSLRNSFSLDFLEAVSKRLHPSYHHGHTT